MGRQPEYENGPWQLAELSEPLSDDSWVQWKLDTELTEGDQIQNARVLVSLARVRQAQDRDGTRPHPGAERLPGRDGPYRHVLLVRDPLHHLDAFSDRLAGRQRGGHGRRLVAVEAEDLRWAAGLGDVHQLVQQHRRPVLGRKLLETLEIKNEDFGLSGSKSLKNFITAGSFLGTSMVPWGDTMINFLAETERSFLRQSMTDDDESSDGEETECYQDLLRLLRLYRAPKEVRQLGLLEKIDLADNLCAGEEQLLANLLSLLDIDPQEAYAEVENHLLERLKNN